MWKRDEETYKPLANWNKIEELVKWNFHWDPPGELSSFYYWSDTDLRWKERDLNGFDSYGRKTTDPQGRPVVTTLDKPRKKSVSSTKEPKNLNEDYRRGGIIQIETPSSRAESAVLEVRTGVNLSDLEELKNKFGWERELDWHQGYKEFVWVHGQRIRVRQAQQSINRHFGKMYIREDDVFGPQTANLLHKLDTTHRR